MLGNPLNAAADPAPLLIDLSGYATTLTTGTEIVDHYDAYFADVGWNIAYLHDSLLLECPSVAQCTDDRKVAEWIDLYPTLPVFHASDQEHAYRTLLLGYKREIYRSFIEARGVLRAVIQEQDTCPETMDDHYPATNEEFFAFFEEHAQHTATDPVLGQMSTDLLATTVWRPFHAECICDVLWGPPTTYFYCDVSVLSVWELGWKNAEGAAPSAASDRILFDLFAAVDGRHPEDGGAGLSRREVACDWITHDPAAGYDPCDFPFYDLATTGAAAGYVTNPTDMRGMPWTQALWVADQGELDGGGPPVGDSRPATDPDVLSSFIPRLAYGSCPAAGVAPPRSSASGKPAQVLFSNLTDADIDVYMIPDAGDPQLKGTFSPQVAAAFPANGQFSPAGELVPGAAVGDVYLVRRGGSGLPPGEYFTDGNCLGTWTVLPRPAGAVVPYSVAEVHGGNGILLDWDW